jgi:hypothetical protein
MRNPWDLHDVTARSRYAWMQTFMQPLDLSIPEGDPIGPISDVGGTKAQANAARAADISRASNKTPAGIREGLVKEGIQAGQVGERITNMQAAPSTAQPGPVTPSVGLLRMIGNAINGFLNASLAPPVMAQQYTTTSTSGTVLTSQSQTSTTPTSTTASSYQTTSTSGQTLPTQTQTSTTMQSTTTPTPNPNATGNYGLPTGSQTSFGFNASTGQYTATIRTPTGTYVRNLGTDEASANAAYADALALGGYANQQGLGLQGWGTAGPGGPYGPNTMFSGGPGNPYQAGGIPGGTPEYSGGGAVLEPLGNGQYGYQPQPINQLTPGQWYQGGTGVPITPWPRQGVATMT